MNKALEIAILLTAVDKMNEVIDKAVGKANKTLHSMSEIGGKAALGGTVMTEFFMETISEAEKNEIAIKRLQQVYKSMGEATGEAAKQNQEYAEKLALQTGIDDESIMAVEAKLATFKSVSSEVGRMSGLMDRATAAAEDMAATGFGEASQNAVQLGKALEDPIKGINSLRRTGITFTDAERKKIAALVDSNKKLDAQRLIMKAIEKQVGGVAAATATNASKMKVSWDDVIKSLGKILLPIMNSLIFSAQKYLPIVQAWIENHKGLVKYVAALGVGLLVLGTVLKILALSIGTVIKVFNGLVVVFDFLAANPIILIITAIALAALLIYKYWDNIVAFFKTVWDGIKAVFAPIALFFKVLWTVVKTIFSLAWDWIKGLFERLPIVGTIIKNWSKIKTFFTELWEGVKEKISSFMDWMLAIPRKMWNVGVNIAKSLWEGIKSMIMKTVDVVKDMFSKLPDFMNPFKIASVVSNTLRSNQVVNTVNRTSNFAGAGAGRSGPGPSSGAGGHTITYSPVIHMTGTASKEDFSALLKKHQGELVRVIAETNRKSNRSNY